MTPATERHDRLAKRALPGIDLRAVNPVYVFLVGFAFVLAVWALFLNR
jgi:hypothetical protein